MAKLGWTLLTAVALVGLIAPSAAATHMSWYAQFFVEHDDQGRVDEPDFQATGVLGVTLSNCIVDLTPGDPGCIQDAGLPAPPPNHASVLAPGCTDDSGRQPSGLCGMYTIGIYHPEIGDPSLAVPPKVVGVQGMSGSDAPGRVSLTKATQVRFLDIRTNAHFILPGLANSMYFDYNHKMQDSGASAALRSIDPNLGSNAILADTGIWAWYGTWADKNGNGVVDHLGNDGCVVSVPCQPNGGLEPDNEFVWIGKCLQFNGQPAPDGQKYCSTEPGVAMPVWVFPGNHHAVCGGILPVSQVPVQTSCSMLSADLPGKQAMCFVDVLTGIAGGTGVLPIFCEQDLAFFDETDEDFFGDSILGPQYAIWPDMNMGDRTGEPVPTGRQWVYGFGWQTRFSDQSAVATTIVMGGITLQPFNPEDRKKLPYDMSKFQNFDIDVYKAVNPEVERLVQTELKGTARGTWVPVRDNFVPILNTTDAVRNDRRLDTSPQTQALDDQFVNPGWSREPNTAEDSYPAAKFNVFAPSSELSAAEQRHRGWLNDYSGHLGTWHAFADVQATRMYHTQLAWRNPVSGSCFGQVGLCVTGGGTFSTNQYLSGLTGKNQQHQRTMEPGIYVFTGFVGAWRDQPGYVFDELVDIDATLAAGGLKVKRTDYTVQPDGWMGNIVNTTGTWKYRGYPGPTDAGAPECTIYGVKAVRYFGECNPYYNGDTLNYNPYGSAFQDTGVDIEDPQTGGVEFAGFPVALPAPHIINVFPGKNGKCDVNDAGTWSAPVIRWNQFDTWRIGDTTAIIDFTGKSAGAAVIRMPAGQGTGLFTRDVLLMPLGNQGVTVCTMLEEQVVIDNPVRGIHVDEFIRDVDSYASWL